MEKYFTGKIYRTFSGVDDSCTADCVDVHLTPFSDGLAVDEVAIYWKRYVLRCPAFDAGSYLVEVSLTRHPVKSFVQFCKPLKK